MNTIINLFLVALFFSFSPVWADVAVPSVEQEQQSETAAPQQQQAVPTDMDKEEMKGSASVAQPVLDNKYSNSEKGYSIDFPKNWEIKEGFMGLDVFSLSPLEGSDDKFRENVNVVTEDLPSSMTPEEYFQAGLKHLKTLLTDFKEEGSGKIDINGEEAIWIVYDHRLGEIKAKVLQIFFVPDGEKAYIITATAEPSEFNKYEPTFLGIAKSFQFDLSDLPKPKTQDAEAQETR